MAGSAAQVQFLKIAQIAKVRSHCSKEQATALGQLMHHRGHELVDALAARARPEYEPKEIEQYLSDQRARPTTIRSVVQRLSLAQRKVKSPEKPKAPFRVGGDRKRRRQPGSPHNWMWSRAQATGGCAVYARQGPLGGTTGRIAKAFRRTRSHNVLHA